MPVGEVTEQPVHAVDCGGVGSCRKSMYSCLFYHDAGLLHRHVTAVAMHHHPVGGTTLGDGPADAAGRPGYEKRSFRLGQS